jgi:aspartate racemase
MKRIGLIGGMSWESTADYYRYINQAVSRQLGGLHSADIVLRSLDFAPIEAIQGSGDWTAGGRVLADAARDLEAAGAELVVLCTNTMHKVAAQITDAVNVPFLHIAEVTAAAVTSAGIERVGLLGTRFTMEERFYTDVLETAGIAVQIPPGSERAFVDHTIFHELCLGTCLASSRERFLEIVESMVQAGAGGIISGCTEIGMLIKAADLPVPFFDTTRIHAEAAVAYALS